MCTVHSFLRSSCRCFLVCHAVNTAGDVVVRMSGVAGKLVSFLHETVSLEVGRSQSLSLRCFVEVDSQVDLAGRPVALPFAAVL